LTGYVLASRSPRRRDLLASVGETPEVRPSEVDETPLEGEAPLDYVVRVAWAKAEACASDDPVLASDTVVALDGECLGKAEDRARARGMLNRLSGRSHWVHTAVVLLADPHRQAVVSAEVVFRPLSALEIERYLDTSEPYDKAGAYGIQGRGGAFVDRIFGSYSAVVGLPVKETLQLLDAAGLRST
jgi:septum formation protein